MKVQFSKSLPYVPEFNDNRALPEAEQLKFDVRPMTTLDLLDLTDILKTAGFTVGSNADLSTDQMRIIVTEAGKYVPKYSTMHGAEGFDINEVISFPAFLALASEVLFQLVNVSSPNKDDVKNS